MSKILDRFKTIPYEESFSRGITSLQRFVFEQPEWTMRNIALAKYKATK